jgi:ABC-type amino acid transport substrate-binding protein
MQIVLIFLLLLQACGTGFFSVPKVGVDPSWVPLDFGAQTRAVNGYTEEFLMEVAHENQMEIEKITVNWDALLDGLNQGKYDAVLTSLPPYEYNLAKYDFSKNYLDLGPVMLVPVGAERKELSQVEMAGILVNDKAALILEKYPTIIIRSYNSIPDLLNALVRGEVNAVLLDRIPAVNYVSDLYAGKLMMVGKPLTDTGLHMIALKGKQHQLLKAVDRTSEKTKNLQAKWGL